MVSAGSCECIFPKDESGAQEAGVAVYIDRQLAGPYGRDAFPVIRKTLGGIGPEHGYQGEGHTREIYREGIPDSGPSSECRRQRGEELLRRIEKTMFFFRCCAHTPSKAVPAIPCMEGMHGDGGLAITSAIQAL